MKKGISYYVRYLLIEQNVGLALEYLGLRNFFNEGVAEVDPVPLALVLVASVGDIMPAAHAS
jgi:hypothetical protein